MSLLYCHQYLENANVSTKFFNIFPHNLLQQQKHRERKHTVRRKRNDKRDWCKGKTWLWSVCTKRINMILTKWKEVDIKRGQIALCKDRCGRPWSSTRAYKVKRRGRRKKKKTVSGLTSGGILAPSLTVLPSTVMWYTCPSVSVNTKCSLAEIAWLVSDLLSASCRRL